MEWRYSDGTVVTLDEGAVLEVAGNGPFATELQRQLRLVPEGYGPMVQVGLPPGGVEDLNPRDPWSVDCWLRQTLRRTDGVVQSSVPEVPSPPASESVPGRVY